MRSFKQDSRTLVFRNLRHHPDMLGKIQAVDCLSNPGLVMSRSFENWP
jgi:hypothetical protein